LTKVVRFDLNWSVLLKGSLLKKDCAPPAQYATAQVNFREKGIKQGSKRFHESFPSILGDAVKSLPAEIRLHC